MWDETRGLITFDMHSIVKSQLDVLDNLINYIPEIISNIKFFESDKKYKIDNINLKRKGSRNINHLLTSIVKELPMLSISSDDHGSLIVTPSKMVMQFGPFGAIFDRIIEEDGEEELVDSKKEKLNDNKKGTPKDESDEGLRKESIDFINDMNNQIKFITLYLAGLSGLDPILKYNIDIDFPLYLFIEETEKYNLKNIDDYLKLKFKKYTDIKTEIFQFNCCSDDNKHRLRINVKNKRISYQVDKECMISNFNIYNDIKDIFKIANELQKTIMS